MSVEFTSESLFEGCEPSVTYPVTNRMFHLDASGQYKLRGLLECCIPAVFDAWRSRFDMPGVIASGVWPFVSHIDVEAAPEPMAAGHTGELKVSLAAGRIAPGQRGEGALVMGTVIEVLAFPGGSKQDDFMDVGDGGGLRGAGRYRGVGALVKPFAPPEERVLKTLPPQMAELPLVSCGLPPSIPELSAVGEGHNIPEQGKLSFRSFWSSHHTDANQVVYYAEYARAAEDVSAHLAHSCGLAGNAFRMTRGRALMKAPFFAGQAYECRATLHVNGDTGRAISLVGFHAVDAAGHADERPAAFVRIDASC